ncbi:AMP-binding protein [Asticcacaulis endophyticus]|uniref:Acyl-ACP synthetase n=1 Tax=Asticcacaulis endophyticus TaxID=1395890 RepID=A0A918QB33_9CAUL|nr:AMP-binding protein [Asticcacaulis endophyticus]GGZ37734.1 acyl-ACP synthetase [Asticcacaulis endophyticus]
MERSFNAEEASASLFDVLTKVKSVMGADRVILEDQERKPISYKEFFQRTFALARLIKKHIGIEPRTGLMLPTSIGGVISFFALHANGTTPVMINFTAGQANIRSAAKLTRLKTVLTSRRFIEQAKLEDLVESMADYVNIIYLDDLRKHLSLDVKAYALWGSLFPKLAAHKAQPTDAGVILFTSGSFGTPRGVVLSQSNLTSNVAQLDKHINIKREWIAFNPLPIFHSLGLTGGVLLPLLLGLRSFQYPSPLHVKQIPALIKDTKASLFFSTDTFLNQYARSAEPDSFTSLDFIVCGAEKVREETHQLFTTQFGGAEILEGYGVTEASPVVAVNNPEYNRHGTVGRLLPGLSYRLDPVEGIAVGGRLFIKGPNVMAGYLDEANPDVVDAPTDGWHDTGDIVNIDDEGCVHILGRAKRFAKIAGEMVSLTAVERIAEEVWPQSRHAVVAVSDDKKGERLVLITDNSTADVTTLTDWAKENGAPILAIPKKILKVNEVPVLGSGKTDYVTLQRLADIEVRAA